MIKLEEILTSKELKTRKRWLFWIISLPLVICIIFSLIGLFFIIAPLSSVMAADPSRAFIAIFGIVTTFLFLGLGGFYIPYRCCYQAHGTRYLTLMIALTILSASVGIFGQVTGWKSKHIVLFIFETLLSLFYIYLSVKLLQINKKILKSRLVHSENYKKALAAFESAVTPDECIQLRDAHIEALSTYQERDDVVKAYKEFTSRSK